MATQDTPTPHVLVLGHSFIRHLHKFIDSNPKDLDLTFQIMAPAEISWHGVGGRTVAKMKENMKRFQDAGLRDLCIEVTVIAEGPISGVLYGYHYKRAAGFHKLVYEALLCLSDPAADVPNPATEVPAKMPPPQLPNTPTQIQLPAPVEANPLPAPPPAYGQLTLQE
ncbi:hypothetical protein OS493_002041 [Desmophyllum pertusum]|uniref:Uncharacterized protein n=1 Tax=Desmophyllum pertusum TaxID=174260 RepID=A0A9W9Z7E9_9CNID|nr:hypothetical protein OS493_002041 [Desmophyllum pertusum]